METSDLVMLNEVIRKFFDDNPPVTSVPSKDLMSLFIDAKIFTKDHRDGLPIRKILRKLDNEGVLHLIPSARPERKKKNTYWYFERRDK